MPTQPPTPQGTPPPYPGDVKGKRKGLSPLGWLGIGCGGLLALAIIAGGFVVGWGKRKFEEVQDRVSVGLAKSGVQSAVETTIEMNPDLELISDDLDLESVRVRVISTGEELELGYPELMSGRFQITGPDGELKSFGSSDLSVLPNWIPSYPNRESELLTFHKDEGSGTEGLLYFETEDPPESVVAFYDVKMAGSSGSTATSVTVGDAARIERSFRSTGQRISILVTRADPAQKTQIQLAYEGVR